LVTIQDEALAGIVRNSLAQDKRIGGQAIAVRVAQGEVFLKGLVDSEDQRQLAELVVRGISGVRYVNTDELRVRGASE
jgi:osmotically-inducible protein OsmY